MKVDVLVYHDENDVIKAVGIAGARIQYFLKPGDTLEDAIAVLKQKYSGNRDKRYAKLMEVEL